MKDNKNITIKELTSILNISRDTINEHISKLKKENKLDRKGGRKDGYWDVKIKTDGKI